jgi:hypothetical protein
MPEKLGEVDWLTPTFDVTDPVAVAKSMAECEAKRLAQVRKPSRAAVKVRAHPQLPPQAGKSRQEAPIGGNRRFRGSQYYSVTGRMRNPGRFIILKLSAHHFRHRARITVRQQDFNL